MRKAFYLAPLALALGLTDASAAQAQARSAEGGTIRAPHGTSYSVESSTEVMKPDPVTCGYNSAGVSRMGVYRRQLRVYTYHNQGRLVRTWRETVDVFQRCYRP